MSKQDILNLKKNRMNKLIANGKNVKCGGCVRKLAREIRNLEK